MVIGENGVNAYNLFVNCMKYVFATVYSQENS